MFLSFSAYLIPFWLKIMPERGFLIFWFFLYFFRNYLALVEYERNPGLKFFSLFLRLYQPILANNNAGNGFFTFLNFLAFFFWNFLARVEYERNSGINFFFSFQPSPNPFCIQITPELSFLIFLNFFTIFYLEFSSLGWVGTEFGSRMFFSLSRPISSRFGKK